MRTSFLDPHQKNLGVGGGGSGMKAQESMEGLPKTDTPRVSPFHATLHSAFSN